MNERNGITADDLNAFVDERLPPARQHEVEAWLARHPEEAATVWAYRLQSARLHEVFDAVLDEPVPSEMRAIVTERVLGRRGGSRPLVNIAASVMLLIVGGIAGWYLHAAATNEDGRADVVFVERAIGAHRVFVAEVRHPVEVGADQETHLARWLSKRLATELRIPNLQSAGFDLVGGRLLAEGPKPAAQLMYEDASGKRMTLYVRGADAGADTSFHFTSHAGVSAFYWMEKAFAYALVAPMQREPLLEIANKVYAALEAR